MPTKNSEDVPRSLTAEEKTAVYDYAMLWGKNWKARLSGEWMRASAHPILHNLRNTHGPAWLQGFKLENIDA